MIFRYLPNSNEWASLETLPCAREQIDSLFSDASRHDWRVPALRVDTSMGEIPDFPSLIQPLPVVSSRAWHYIETEFGDSLQALEVMLEGIDKPFFLLDVPVIDCLDRELSELRISSVDGNVSRIKRYAFHDLPDESIGLFKLPETRGLETLVTDQFRRLIDNHGLQGLTLKPLRLVS